ncbi:MAG TPA: hypothetical protein VFC03_16400 [Acidimicrobiales bacterium]|nr:hypothetical protein [Acidimicrobiales bacterium]
MFQFTTRFAIAFIATALSFSAFAQTQAMDRSVCTFIGMSPPEPLNDRQGHTISISQFTCKAEGGVLDGAVMTGSQIYEWNGVNAVGHAGYGVYRKPGATVIYVNDEMKNMVIMADGKPAGFAASGRGHHALATGTAASLNGKTYTYTAKPIGPGQFLLEGKVDS